MNKTLQKNIVYNPAFPDVCRGDLLPGDSENPAVLLIHGGGWSSSSKERFANLAAAIADAGFTVFNIDYRLAPAAPWPACGADCLDAATWLLANNESAGDRGIFTAGASAGGHLALMTALRLPSEKIRGAVSISGIGDLREDFAVHPARYRTLFGLPANASPGDAEFESASPLNFVTASSPPILLTHYTHDAVVPFSSAEKFVRGAADKGAVVELCGYFRPGLSGHGIWHDDRAVPPVLSAHLFQTLLAFLKTHAG